MGNQQERSIQEARIAMLFETEGYFSLRVIKRGPEREYDIKPVVGVTNTSSNLIEWTAKTLDDFKIGRYVQWVKPHGLGKLPQGRVLIEGIKRVSTFLPIIRPWMLVKAEQADLIQEFISSRLSNMGNYTDRELEIADKVRRMAQKGPKPAALKSSETLCRTPKWTKTYLVEDKVRPSVES